MKTLFIILITISLSQNVFASKEGVLPFSEFQVHSNGIGSSGKINVFGKQNENGTYTEVTVEAFGKKIIIPKTVLAQIPSNYQNGIQLSYEHGYKVLGGKVIYLKFTKGFVNSNLNSIVIRIRENGNVDVLSKSEP